MTGACALSCFGPADPGMYIKVVEMIRNFKPIITHFRAFFTGWAVVCFLCPQVFGSVGMTSQPLQVDPPAQTPISEAPVQAPSETPVPAQPNPLPVQPRSPASALQQPPATPPQRFKISAYIQRTATLQPGDPDPVCVDEPHWCTLKRNSSLRSQTMPRGANSQ